MSCFALIIITIFFFFLLLTLPSNANFEIINQVCKASRDPPTCQTSFSNTPIPIPPNATVLQAIQSALFLSWHNLNTSVSMVQDIRDASAENNNIKTRVAAERCLEVLRYSQHRMGQSVDAAAQPNNARAWLSAVLAHEHGCLSGILQKMNITLPPVSKALAFFNSTLIVSTADALAMVANYDDHRIDTAPWAPTKTERDGYYPNHAPKKNPMPARVPSGLKANATVCKAGCDYGTVQEAVRAAPNNSDSKFVIRVWAGVYEETVVVPFETRNVVLLGDGMGRTVITGDKSVGIQGLSTYETATVSVVGDGFMAAGITVENTAGYGGNQAVAFRSESDLSVLEGCEFLGNQDTLYASALRQYYKSCRIVGNVDFVFGGSAAYFEDCGIFVGPRQGGVNEKGEGNTVTAHARVDPAQSTGFVFRNCVVNGTDAYMRLYYENKRVHRNYLGRPWREYSRTVYINCTLGEIVSPEGWMAWSGEFGLDTLYYGEYGNTGPGNDTTKRVPWSNQIAPEHVNTYTFENFFG